MLHSSKRALTFGSIASLVVLGSVGLAPSAFAAPADDAANQTHITIAAITDFHGHIENASQLAASVDQLRASSKNFFFVGNGDLVGGSAYVSSIQQDQPTIKILGKMGLQLSGTGNHEFDKGYDDFKNRIIPAANNAGWSYTLASVDGVDTNVLPPYKIIKTADGVRVAFVSGVTKQLPTLVSPDGLKNLTVKDDQKAIDEVAAQLKDGNDANGEADIVVALDHSDSAKAASLGPNVDAVVAGHTHLDASTKTASGAPVVEPEYYGKALGQIDITYDNTAKKVVSATGKVNELTLAKRDANGALPAGTAYNADVEADYQKAAAVAKQKGSEKVGSLAAPAVRGANDAEKNDTGANRGTESTLGNMVAESFYQFSQTMPIKADFGINNPGGVRADLRPGPDGTITLEQSNSQMPFGNSFGTRSYTGAQVVTMLEQQWKLTGERPILRLGLSKNVYYTYDPAAEYGHHITGVYINGKPIDPNAKYTIASNAYLLAGGDSFDVLKEGSDFVDTGIIDNDAFNDFLKANPDYAPDESQHSIGITGADKLKQGEKVSLDLSSLSMTSSDDKRGDGVVVYLNGQHVASAKLDNMVTPSHDETGRATVTFTVPANAPADSKLRIVVGNLAQDGTLSDPVTDVTANVKVAAAEAVPSPEPTATPTAEPTAEPTEPTAPAKPQLPSKAVNAFNFDVDGNFSIDKAVSFGQPRDEAFVGDFDGNGLDTPAVRRGNRIMISNLFDGGAAAASFSFGRPGDQLIVGDFDGDGKDSFAVRRGNHVFVSSGPNNRVVKEFAYGRPGDEVVAGDFNRDGKDTLAVRRGKEIFVKNSLAGGNADVVYAFGRAGDVPIAGDFDGDGKDTIAVRRGTTLFVTNVLSGGEGQAHRFGAANATVFAGTFADKPADDAADKKADTFGYRN